MSCCAHKMAMVIVNVDSVTSLHTMYTVCDSVSRSVQWRVVLLQCPRSVRTLRTLSHYSFLCRVNAFIRIISLTSHHLLFYVDYTITCQKSLNYIDAFHCYT